LTFIVKSQAAETLYDERIITKYFHATILCTYVPWTSNYEWSANLFFI